MKERAGLGRAQWMLWNNSIVPILIIIIVICHVSILPLLLGSSCRTSDHLRADRLTYLTSSQPSITLIEWILYDVAAFSHAFFESYIFTTSLERAL